MKVMVEWIKTGKVESMQERYAKPLVEMGYCRQRNVDDPPPPPPDPSWQRTRGKYVRRDMRAETVSTLAPVPTVEPVVPPAPVVEVEPIPEPVVTPEFLYVEPMTVDPIAPELPPYEIENAVPEADAPVADAVEKPRRRYTRRDVKAEE